MDFLRASSLGGNISSKPKKIAPRRLGGSSFPTKGKRLLSIKESQMSPGICRFSVYEKMQQSGLTEIIPLIHTSASGAGILCFSYSKFPLITARWQVLFSFLSFSGFASSLTVGGYNR